MDEDEYELANHLIGEARLWYYLGKSTEADENVKKLDKMIKDHLARKSGNSEEIQQGNSSLIHASASGRESSLGGTGSGWVGSPGIAQIHQFYDRHVMPNLRWCYDEVIGPFIQSPTVWFFDTAGWILGLGAIYTQPFIYAALILGLTLIGINEIYVPNSTFGTNPFPDYLAIFTWGLGSDVVSRSLSNLKKS